MKRIFFYKESSGRWYADIPEWTGNKEELEMVMGADSLLDIISEGENKICILFSKKAGSFNNKNVLRIVENAADQGGMIYKVDEYNGIYIDLRVFLCDVTKFIFGEFPTNIYFCKSM